MPQLQQLEDQQVYRVRPGFRVKTSPQVIGEQLEALRAQADGDLHPSTVVEAARPEGAPLHDEFIWQDDLAADLQRLARARGLINSVIRVVVRVGLPPAECLQSVRVVRVEEQPNGRQTRESVYVAPEAAFSREDWRQQVFDDCDRQIAGLQNRLRLLGETQEVVAALERARARLAQEAERQARPKGAKKGKGGKRPQAVVT